VSAFGVVIAGIMVWLTHSTMPDSIASFLIAALIVYSSWGILKESVTVLLEGAPHGMDVAAVAQCIGAVEGVQNVHDLHVWTVGPGAVACSCHIVVSEQTIATGNQILKAVVEQLAQRFHINHTTVQVEVEGCGPNEMYCNIRAEQHEHHH
jgi:cobalt-zinc-cadmium efflux system protein